MILPDNRNEEELQRKAHAAGQGHIFRFWDRLSPSSRSQLLHQVTTIDFQLIDRLYHELVLAGNNDARPTLEPVEVISLAHQRQHPPECREMIGRGEELLRRGRVAALLVAGGQGSRLGFDGPKGAFPIGPVSGKCLFQLHAEKLSAISRRYGSTVPWFIMTSESNDQETRSFFQQHNFFGYPAGEVTFFVQGMMPAMDQEGKVIMDAVDHIFMNPDGHGGTLRALARSGALAEMRRRGIEEVFYFQVDNVLVKICDPLFIGYHAAAGADMSAKVCGKRDPYEKLGVIGRKDGRLAVIEYSDMSREDMEARLPGGALKYNCGNLAMHMLHVDFLEREVEGAGRLPWHLAHKQIPFIDDRGVLQQPDKANGYKFEAFIFDALGDARASVLLEVDRRFEFSPVKNFTGVDSPQTAQRDLINMYADWLAQAGVRVPRDGAGAPASRIEISPMFALDAEELARKIDPALQVGPELHLT